MKYNSSTLRQGFTTGSAAAAAAKAAIIHLVFGHSCTSVNIPVPPGAPLDDTTRLDIPLARVWAISQEESAALVIKDGGDDPDATHRARISCRASRINHTQPCDIIVEGGRGVGRVTLPGLPVPVGHAAINPAPLAQIKRAVAEVSPTLPGLRLVIEVEDGETIAQKTLNPRLGIVGGISILGTSGIVVPYSSEAWKAAIDESLSVARAQGITTIFLTTGRKSERFLRNRNPHAPAIAYVHMADYVGHTVSAVTRAGFHDMVFGLFFGKLVKISQQYAHTHAHVSHIDFSAIAKTALQCGIPEEITRRIETAVTARHVLELVAGCAEASHFIDTIGQSALAFLTTLSPLPKRLHVFDFDGTILWESDAVPKEHTINV
ncbi:cobalt-precorrin-5B (C(1))-methyltransferase CbiD [Desulfovibrio inopinatus]|uniref:cobalt-precorrin-5B (C(1))-methyltransferase CbiD n=1 Tax=Desulfovibrio inopinatus TaxID=102109 RepID=UPI000411507F|nr:cobalt-precorrin-5B (C(1))-methyltransferase CbiD [Desulfovibrio inopinatus]